MTTTRHDRIGRQQLHELARTLNSTDWKILEDFSRFRLLSARHIQRLHFGDESKDDRRCRRRLNQLCDSGVLQRLPRRVGGRGNGSDSTVLRVGRVGRRLIDGATGAGPSWQPSEAFAAHTLGIVDLYVELRSLEPLGELVVEVFDPEPGAWRTFTWGMHTVTVKPDAFVLVTKAGVQRHYFIELDLGTESMTVIGNKIGRYLNYYRSGPDLDVFPQVLFLVDAAASYHTRGTIERTGQITETAQAMLVEEVAALVLARPLSHPPWSDDAPTAVNQPTPSLKGGDHE